MPDLTLDLRYLKYAVQVAEAGSFRRAAERLSISQSTVSRRVQLLSFSEDDCTRQRGLKAVVQSSIERTVSGVRCTNDDLKPVLVALATDQPLDVRYRDHDLSGDWAGYRECHIKPDLLLIYRKSDADTLRLARLGSHSELFG
ncbi:type II toxin-antitoxin system mRNA interferase toxin, RelE/StbE family [Aeromonas hydrophila]|uniref:Type II toxin-antitoxin system mRNA interferase toxin, RelE/StbE family n=9 Tax=Gammaproteobacteria TaxID=1236 RepID=A0A3L0W2M8_ECOLX|nr:type II toxin-antitoxin system mRNA interferase toxin, RelE/StbE family [Aeromonas sp. ASNIH7]EGN2330362.1 type II toxin-antitoxin system mRNA interferase toxin, RelE/StbE family [Escherichia coli]EQC03233.1 addiction module antitoxin [Aeromonas salmonicida subsp. pectinolytica 34mel]MBE9979708.1 type II toxin-antitoxin system mRNA interferase toxin, RelE/StbE family [Citrobacter freundii]OUI24861.1 hypothetical protein AZZ74_005475 [Klebsiella pneumoniae]OZP65514.1 type II toxin-antitoxin 